MNVARRPSLMMAGEPLLLCDSTIEMATRSYAFIEESGLPPQAVLSSPLCAMPLPIYTDFGLNPVNGNARPRWEGTRAEFMWHPLMWLPTRLAGRYRITDADTGSAELEDDTLWAIRMAFELTASGLYEPSDGTWLDVLATVGLDVDDELDVARVQDWLNGYPDELLDSVSLADYLDIDPESWASESALTMRSQLEGASWALIADDLVALIDSTTSHGLRLEHTDQLKALRSVTSLAETLLVEVPAPRAGDVIAVTEEPNAEFFATLRRSVDLTAGTPDAVTLIDHMGRARERLVDIRDLYWDDLTGLRELPEPTDEPAGAS